jgi:hypothetical protein
MNQILNPLLLSTAILLAPEISKGDDTAAIRAFAKATYVQTGMNVSVKNIEKRLISDSMRTYGGYVALVTKVFTERKITYEFRF